MPSYKDGHVDQLLTNISVAYIQSADKFIADKVFPRVGVENASDFFLTYPRGAFMRDDVGPRPLGGQSPIADYKVDKDRYGCEEEGLQTTLDDRQRANYSNPYNPERTKTLFLTQQALIHRDRTWAAKYFKAGVWTAQVAGVANAPGANQVIKWSDYTNSDPIEDVDVHKDTIAEKTGFEPNVLVLGRKVFRYLKNHPTILERIKYTQRGVLTAELLAQLFGVDRVLVPGGVWNKAPEGVADEFEFILPSDKALLAYAAPNPALDQPSAGYIFTWNGLLGQDAYDAGIWRGRDERAHSDWFEIRMAYDQRQVAQDLAVFFDTLV